MIIHRAFAEGGSDVFVVFVKKEEQKKQSRWTLDEWLRTKNRMNLMDQWLAMNSSSNFFEGIIGGFRGSFEKESPLSISEKLTEEFKFKGGELQLYFTIFGLEAEYEDTEEKTNARKLGLGLRLFGRAQQSTHLTLNVGQRKFNEEQLYSNNYIGGTLGLYILKFLGFEGLYHYYMVSKAVDGPNLFKGSTQRLGAFLDLKFIRFYYHWTLDKFTTQVNVESTERSRAGHMLGVRLYF